MASVWMFTLAAVCSLAVLALAEFTPTVDPDCQKLMHSTPISHLVSNQVYTFQDEKKEYEYKLAVCANVAPYTRQTVTQRELVADAKRTVVVGRLNGTHVIKRQDYVELTYYFGDQYHTHCSNTHRTARIMFVCDPCGGRGSPQVVEEYTTDSKESTNSHCFYQFEWATSDVCNPKEGGRLVICKPTGLGPGSIVLIVLLSTFAAYIILGFVFNRFIRGAKGNEQCPNYAFWAMCGDRMADGCDVVCRSKPPSIQMKPIPSVGRGDHQLDLSGDDLE